MLTIVCAYFLDLILGDPRWLPHPVRGIGWLISFFEKILRKIFVNERLAGIVLTLIIVLLTTSLTWYIIYIANYFNKVFGVVVSIIVLYTTFSVKDLKVEAEEVYKALKNNNLTAARKKLSMIVGRDTENLDEQEIIRATVESVSENIVDSIISPIFYAFIGGPLLAMTYKAINTLDSMVGYQNKKYKNFGWFAAKVDTIANFLPAILAVILVPFASLICRKKFINSFKIVFRDGLKYLNSNISEAAISGALEVQLGGINYYQGEPVIKRYLGDKKNDLSLTTITETIKISYVVSLLIVGIPVFCQIVIKCIF